MIHSKPPPCAALARQLSKLIAALDKQWQEELGGPEAPATALVLQKAQRLLTRSMGGQPLELADGRRLADHLGRDWMEANPWAAGHIARIDSLLTDGGQSHSA